MMKNVFLDTNILLDFVDKRDKYEQAKFIISQGRKGAFNLHASYLTFANMAFILRHRPQAEKYKLLNEAHKGIDVVLPTSTHLEYALAHEVKDFEDLLQYLCALDANCDIIVTNNPDDFEEFCELPFMTSEQFVLASLLEEEST